VVMNTNKLRTNRVIFIAISPVEKQRRQCRGCQLLHRE
jgi:hypothetical protein